MESLLRNSSGVESLYGHAGAMHRYPLLSKYSCHSSQQLLPINVPVMKTIDLGNAFSIFVLVTI